MKVHIFLDAAEISRSFVNIILEEFSRNNTRPYYYWHLSLFRYAENHTFTFRKGARR